MAPLLPAAPELPVLPEVAPALPVPLALIIGNGIGWPPWRDPVASLQA
jgi:hypothetical protein